MDVGIRPGEKLHEEMITESDSYNTVDLGEYYAILPTNRAWSVQEYAEKNNATVFPEGKSYSSGTNEDFLTVDELKKLIKSNV